MAVDVKLMCLLLTAQSGRSSYINYNTQNIRNSRNNKKNSLAMCRRAELTNTFHLCPYADASKLQTVAM